MQIDENIMIYHHSIQCCEFYSRVRVCVNVIVKTIFELLFIDWKTQFYSYFPMYQFLGWKNAKADKKKTKKMYFRFGAL